MEKIVNDNIERLQEIAKERTVKTQNIEYDLETLVKKIEKKIIKLNPEYQRNHRWDIKTSSRLIESLILNIPIPTVYLSQDVDVDEEVEEGISRYSVIDGQQRLSAIFGFMKNEYALEELEVLDLLNGSRYEDLPPFLTRRLEERTITCLRIDSTADEQVKYDIFERLNTGAIQLEAQELRNAVYRGKFNELIKNLATNEMFRKLISVKEEDGQDDTKVKKMLDAELVLRFFALENGEINNMKKSFRDFLSEQLQKFNNISDDEMNVKREWFLQMIKLIYDEFGENAFAKYKVDEKEGKDELVLQSHFNAAIYDALMVALAENKRLGNLKIDKDRKEKFMGLFFSDSFRKNIEGSTTDKSKITGRIDAVKDIFAK